MDCGQEYHFTHPDQFWNELDDLIAVSPDSTLDQLDYALRNYVAFTSAFMDEFLVAPGALDHALLALLSSPLFTSHVDRMITSIISSISSPLASSSTLFISLMLVLHLGDTANPLAVSSSTSSRQGAGVLTGSSKVFRMMRRRWGEVVPVLMKWVSDAAVVQEEDAEKGHEGEATAVPEGKKVVGMPAEGWEERVGTAATAVLYEMCRVQKLTGEELAYFTFPFISHLFILVERTRDVEDETFNYSLIKLIIALNEQFMVASVPAPSPSSINGYGAHAHGNGSLPPPILPTVSKGAKRERGTNLVLEVLKEKEDESKTFGENIIFILNRADGTPDSLCVSLLILKILYLLFTTSGTQEFFYTNDLCVLVDVFIRELCDLGEESEGLKHTYLRVLHPLLTNTQLRNHPYKRPQLRRVLEALIAPSSYRDVDPTTRRLVERNLRGSWCQGLRAADAALEGALGEGWGGGSTMSVDQVANAEGQRDRDGESTRTRKHRHHSMRKHSSRRQTSLDDSSSSAYSVAPSAGSTASYASTSTTGTSLYSPSPLAPSPAIAEVGARNAAGDVPYAVKASYESASSSGLTASPELASTPLPPTTFDRRHDLLAPLPSSRQLLSRPCSPSGRSVSSTHPVPSSSSSSSTLVYPRPRSTSLSATSYRQSTHSLGLTDSPPPPPLPFLPPYIPHPPSPSPSTSSSSTAEYPLHPAAVKARRRPPPPPSSAPDSRPRTPSCASSTSYPPSGLATPVPGSAESSIPGSPKVGMRRRAPPPPPGAGTVGGAGGGNALGLNEGLRGLSIET